MRSRGIHSRRRFNGGVVLAEVLLLERGLCFVQRRRCLLDWCSAHLLLRSSRHCSNWDDLFLVVMEQASGVDGGAEEEHDGEQVQEEVVEASHVVVVDGNVDR